MDPVELDDFQLESQVEKSMPLDIVDNRRFIFANYSACVTVRFGMSFWFGFLLISEANEARSLIAMAMDVYFTFVLLILASFFVMSSHRLSALDFWIFSINFFMLLIVFLFFYFPSLSSYLPLMSTFYQLICFFTGGPLLLIIFLSHHDFHKLEPLVKTSVYFLVAASPLLHCLQFTLPKDQHSVILLAGDSVRNSFYVGTRIRENSIVKGITPDKFDLPFYGYLCCIIALWLFRNNLHFRRCQSVISSQSREFSLFFRSYPRIFMEGKDEVHTNLYITLSWLAVVLNIIIGSTLIFLFRVFHFYNVLFLSTWAFLTTRTMMQIPVEKSTPNGIEPNQALDDNPLTGTRQRHRIFESKLEKMSDTKKRKLVRKLIRSGQIKPVGALEEN